MKVEVKTYKLGDYNPDGSLDYKLYLQECTEYESDVAEKKLLEIAVAGEENIEPNHLADMIISSIPEIASIESNLLYSEKFMNSLCDLVVIEICNSNGYTLVDGCSFGPMDVIYRNTDINYDDMLTFKDNKRAVLAWDNHCWYDPRKSDSRLEEKQMS